MKNKLIVILIFLILVALGIWLGFLFFNKGEKPPDKMITRAELKNQSLPFSRPNEFKKHTRKLQKRPTGMKKEDYNIVWDSAENHIELIEHYNSDCKNYYDTYIRENPNYKEKMLNPKDHSSLMNGLQASLMILNIGTDATSTRSQMHDVFIGYEEFEVDRLRSYLLRLISCEEEDYDKLMNDALMSLDQVKEFHPQIKKDVIVDFLNQAERLATQYSSFESIKKSLGVLNSLSRYKLVSSAYREDILYLQDDIKSLEAEFERLYKATNDQKKKRSLFLANSDTLNIFGETVQVQIERIRFELTE